jgi:DNA-binding GntR family transcriptional regulator
MQTAELSSESGGRRAAVYERLRSDIAHGRIAPGQRLSEQGIAEALGVSRTPVREALSQLMSDGLLVALGRGYAAPDLTPANIDDIYEMRLLLEPPIGRHAASQASHDQVVALRRAIDDEAATAGDADPDGFIDANLRYREALFATCPNSRLAWCASLFNDQIRRVMLMTLGPAENRRTTVEFHDAAYDGIKNHDGDRAAAAIAELLYRARASFRASAAADTPAA